MVVDTLSGGEDYEDEDEESQMVQNPGRGITRSRRGQVCSNWVYVSLKVLLVLNILILLFGIPTMVMVAVNLSQTASLMDKKIIQLEETIGCTLNNMCEQIGFGLACEVHTSIRQCGLGLTRGVTTSWAEYFSEYSSGGGGHHSPSSSPSSSSGTPGTSLI